jgi:small glutamine-rich tetratricopeptide repeat-containing protein alpha
MAQNPTSKKRLALAIIDFLNTSLTDGTVPSDESENIEVATNCIAEAFKVDPTDKAAVSDALGGQTLLSIYSVYEKLKGKSTASAATGSSPASGTGFTTTATAAATAAAAGAGVTEAQGESDEAIKKKADALKAQGNAAMQQKDYNKAIDFYTQALELQPLNPIYLSNRAAAYSGAMRHDEAKNDAEMAVAADPKFAKAWSRLGLAKFALGDARGSMEAYQKGIEAEGTGGSEAMRKGYETAKRRVEEEGGTVDGGNPADEPSSRGAAGMGGGLPDLGSLAGMFGGGGGAGGMPNLSEMMNNPMMRQMAQNLMSNPDMLNNLMSNPRVRQMADQLGGRGGGGEGGGGGGGGMPDIASLMQDPSMMEM